MKKNEIKVGGCKPTGEQQSGIDVAKEIEANGRGVLVMEAGAGTGKTTFLTMLEESLNGNGQYTAFNSSFVAEKALGWFSPY